MRTLSDANRDRGQVSKLHQLPYPAAYGTLTNLVHILQLCNKRQELTMLSRARSTRAQEPIGRSVLAAQLRWWLLNITTSCRDVLGQLHLRRYAYLNFFRQP